ncbi:hypothetical protein NHJ13734_008717 [Beauveria thailandica]
MAPHDVRLLEPASPAATTTLTPLSLPSYSGQSADSPFIPHLPDHMNLRIDPGPTSPAMSHCFGVGEGDPSTAWDDADMGCFSPSADILDCNSTEEHIELQKHGPISCSGGILTFDATGVSDLPPINTDTSLLGSVLGTGNDNSAKKVKDSMDLTQELLSLVANIQQQLTKVEAGPWVGDSAASLDEYPVGILITLSQQLSEMADPIFGSDLQDVVEYTENGPNGSYMVPGDYARADTPTILLLICGYKWLVRLHNVALDHFQNYIDQVPVLSAGSHGADNFTSTPRHHRIDGPASTRRLTDPALRLGQLPCTKSVLRLHRIYIAISTLFDILQRIKARLGSSAILVRGAAVSMLRDWDGEHNSSSHALETRVDNVKERLRERLGF